MKQLAAIVFILLLCGCVDGTTGRSDVISPITKTVTLGNVTPGDMAGWVIAYKLTVDSVDYIMVRTEKGVAITQHSK